MISEMNDVHEVINLTSHLVQLPDSAPHNNERTRQFQEFLLLKNEMVKPWPDLMRMMEFRRSDGNGWRGVLGASQWS